MRYAAPALLLMSGCAVDDALVPIPQCNVPCAVDRDGILRLEDEAYDVTCNVGLTVCERNEDRSVTLTCPDFTPISAEVCDPDNVDENCDGLHNDIAYEWYDYRNTCNGVGECRYSMQLCQPDGELLCHPVSLLYGDEVCDGEDNDCDGLTDSADPDLSYEDDFEYTGPEETLNVGECRAGIRRCENGLEYLFGEVKPTEEICGNGDDDDCDGFTDEDDGDTIADAFLISIDFSGSMAGTIEAVIEALCDWSDADIFSNSKFAIQAVAGDYTTEPHIVNVIDFVGPAGACDALESFYNDNGTPGGDEYIPYGIWSVNNVNNLRLEWPEHMRRRVIFFSDEPVQGYNYNYSPTEDIALVTEDCASNNYSVGGFVAGDYATWHLMTDNCNGWLETLSYDPQRMREDLDYRFGSECGVGNVAGGAF